MNALSTFAVVFLVGVATPVFGLKMLVKERGDTGNGCLLNFILAGLVLLILAVVVASL